MKILHIWDCAGVSYILARQQVSEGHTVSVIKREGFDPFGIGPHYGFDSRRFLTGRLFLRWAVSRAADYEVIHIHSIARLVPTMRKKYPDKMIVLHYHGTDALAVPMADREAYEREADLVLVSTDDMLNHVPFAKYLPNPVDIELFRPRVTGYRDRCVYLGKKSQWPMAKRIMDGLGMDIRTSCFFRDISPVQYCDMPSFLCKYGTYVDIKLDGTGGINSVLSMTALQSLAIGMEVMDWYGWRIRDLPDAHLPHNVTDVLHQMYGDYWGYHADGVDDALGDVEPYPVRRK